VLYPLRGVVGWDGVRDAMEIQNLEQRVATLEKELNELKRQLRSLPVKDWRRTVGMFAHDPDFDEIVRLGKEWRDEQNREVE